jgi:hypothetical protein
LLRCQANTGRSDLFRSFRRSPAPAAARGAQASKPRMTVRWAQPACLSVERSDVTVRRVPASPCSAPLTGDRGFAPARASRGSTSPLVIASPAGRHRLETASNRACTIRTSGTSARPAEPIRKSTSSDPVKPARTAEGPVQRKLIPTNRSAYLRKCKPMGALLAGVRHAEPGGKICHVPESILNKCTDFEYGLVDNRSCCVRRWLLGVLASMPYCAGDA